MSKIVFDEPAWWRRPGWQAVVAALLALAAWLIWWTALAPVDHDPIVVRAPTVPRTQPRPVAAPKPQPPPLPLAAPPVPAPAATAAPVPAEPNEGDSEPED